MRLWHIDLIPYLPKSQLLAQWRELNSIFKKQDKHILINYIYNYPRYYLFHYTSKVMNEIKNRGLKIRSYNNYYEYFRYSGETDLEEYYDKLRFTNRKYRFKEHNDEYLTICYYNLKEKYLRGQKDFTKEVWDKLDEFYKNKLKENK